ncbi:MAG TPA: lipoprotein-releasing system ATP-binding protein LolD, partial [Pseudoalteromonas sp.]|nr:lipoprotein-releasing system ATP-binding protein LolD [Pseudoalteromonas sp.]
MNDLVISCEKISKVYQDGQNQVEVLKGVDLALTQGEMLAIVGSSGSGKSTLLHILGTLDTASAGSAKIKNQDVAKLSRSQQAAFRNK